jgi:site-specific DNA-methyltransferase (adenine-specific)/adenine-specific DNA-methyltransferase
MHGWTNKLIWGDNKLILSSLKAGALRQQIEDAGGLKLIYIDPPFDVGADFSMDIEIGGETFHKEPNILEQIAYRDTWGRGADSFISMIYERLILMRDLMHKEGSIYVHLDWRLIDHIRLVLDEIFGSSCYQGCVRWQRQTSSGYKGMKKYGRAHDSILWYSRSDSFKFNPQFVPYEESYIKSHYNQVDEQGRQYRTHWLGTTTKETIAKFIESGRVVRREDGTLEKRLFLDDQPGTPVDDVWTDIFPVNSQAKEDTKYPTQKPEALLDRILRASSNDGDLVADFFSGSGTTSAVAEKLGRKWICSDLGKFGVHTTRKRLIGVQRELKAAGKGFRAFEVLNLGRYERQAYISVGGRLTGSQKAQAMAQKEREFRELILRAYKATPFGESEGGQAQDGFFHGARNGRLVVIGPINLPVGRLFVEEVILESRKRGVSRVDILAFEFEMGLFPAVLEEARGKGLDLAPKQIPPEVFDKRAVERGQVVFFDVSFVGAMPRYDKKNKFAVEIELTDFSVYYTQGAAEAAIAAMKDGKSEVLCEQGQLYKATKGKDGIVKKERLTKHWTDWVDYWAVDFDYMSRREIIRVPKGSGFIGTASLPGLESPQTELALQQFEEQWTGGYIFENEWQSFRTRQERKLELITAVHTYYRPGRYTVAVKVIDIFGNDTMTLVPVNVG